MPPLDSGAPDADPTPTTVVGRRVLEAEAAALHRLAASLGDPFDGAVAAIATLPGRVVVSGIGKSGHVARKIAATLASTGTPALFVHPAEASHGDLGMVLRGDAVLALSNSGETPELADLIGHARRFAIPLLAITAQPGSALARAADHLLLLPEAPEACPMGLAPTTSTTMQLALGDALAVALLERRGFGRAEFAAYHPGGRLGARLRHVGELMHAGDALPLAAPDTKMAEALLLMTGKGFGCLGVVANGRLAGIVTDGDLRRAMGPDLLGRTAGAIMNPGPLTARPGMLAADALRLMNERARPITILFVVDDAGAPIGLLHLHDLLRAGIA